MKKLLFILGLFILTAANAQTPPGFKGQVYSDISSNGYEWVNVDGKEHTIPLKGEYCMAEVKAAQLAPKVTYTNVSFDKNDIAGIFKTYSCSVDVNLGQESDSVAVWYPYKSKSYPNGTHWVAQVGMAEEEYKNSTYYLTCLTNISPKSNMYIKTTQPDLLNLNKIQR